MAVQLALYTSVSFILSFWLCIDICQTHSFNLITPFFCFIKGSRRKQKLCHNSSLALWVIIRKSINRAVIILFHCWIVVQDLMKHALWACYGEICNQLRKTTKKIPRVKYCNLRKEMPRQECQCEKKSPYNRHDSCLQIMKLSLMKEAGWICSTAGFLLYLKRGFRLCPLHSMRWMAHRSYHL